MTDNNERLTEIIRQDPRIARSQASDYSRRPAQITFADVLVLFFAGVVATLVLAFILGSI